MSNSGKFADDSKMALYETERSSRPYIGIALLVISLLLAVSVSALVYQSIAAKHSQPCQQQATQQQPSASVDVDVQSSVTFKTDNGDEIKEEISYSQAQNVAYYHGDDGSFNVDDFAKGIHITRSPDDGTCYLIAVGSGNQTSKHDFERLLRSIDGTEVVVHNDYSNGREVQAKVLPGEVSDTSFIPQLAHKECVSGYKWMAYVPAPAREKRACTWQCSLQYDSSCRCWTTKCGFQCSR